MRQRWILLLLALLLSACGGESSSGDRGDGSATTTGGEGDPLDFDELGDEGEPRVQHGEQSAIETLGITGPDSPWSEMSYEDREFYMIGKVLPITHELFTQRDADRYADFSCESCHGSDGAERRFEMPSTQRSVVHPPGSPQYEQMRQTFPDMVRFMEEEIAPKTGILLGIEGFSCNGCHPSPAG